LASPGTEIRQQRVLIRARVVRNGTPADRLAGSAIASLTTAADGTTTRRVEDWALCNDPWSSPAVPCTGG
jgi:hypothetical protein